MNRILIILLISGLQAAAQTSPFRFGVKAGYNLANTTVNDASGTDYKSGFTAGGLVEYSLSGNFLVQSGLYYSEKGVKVHQLNRSSYLPSPIDDTHTFNQSYITLPLYGAFRLNVTNDFKVVLGVGPYLGYGVGGQTKQKLKSGAWSGGITEIRWNTFGDGIFDNERDYLRGTTLKRLDMGLGGNISFEYHKFILGVGYEEGLRNIAETRDRPNLSYRNNALNFSVGYRF